jgi:hypothetical protein
MHIVATNLLSGSAVILSRGCAADAQSSPAQPYPRHLCVSSSTAAIWLTGRSAAILPLQQPWRSEHGDASRSRRGSCSRLRLLSKAVLPTPFTL